MIMIPLNQVYKDESSFHRDLKNISKSSGVLIIKSDGRIGSSDSTLIPKGQAASDKALVGHYIVSFLGHAASNNWLKKSDLENIQKLLIKAGLIPHDGVSLDESIRILVKEMLATYGEDNPYDSKKQHAQSLRNYFKVDKSTQTDFEPPQRKRPGLLKIIAEVAILGLYVFGTRHLREATQNAGLKPFNESDYGPIFPDQNATKNVTAGMQPLQGMEEGEAREGGNDTFSFNQSKEVNTTSSFRKLEENELQEWEEEWEEDLEEREEERRAKALVVTTRESPSPSKALTIPPQVVAMNHCFNRVLCFPEGSFQPEGSYSVDLTIADSTIPPLVDYNIQPLAAPPAGVAAPPTEVQQSSRLTQLADKIVKHLFRGPKEPAQVAKEVAGESSQAPVARIPLKPTWRAPMKAPLQIANESASQSLKGKALEMQAPPVQISAEQQESWSTPAPTSAPTPAPAPTPLPATKAVPTAKPTPPPAQAPRHEKEVLPTPREISQTAAPAMKMSRSDAMQNILRNPSFLSQLEAREHLEDLSFVEELILQNGLLIEAFPELQNNPKVAMAAVKQNPRAVQFLSESLRSDPKFMMIAMEVDSEVIQYASEKLLKDQAFGLKLVSEYPLALEHLDDTLRNNAEIVQTAIQKDRRATQYMGQYVRVKEDTLEVSEHTFARSWRNDEEDAFKFLKNNRPEFLKQLSSSDVPGILKENPGFEVFLKDGKAAEAAVKEDGLHLQHFKEFQENPAIVLRAIAQNPKAAQFANHELLESAEFMLSAIKINPALSRYLGPKLRDNEQFAEELVAASPLSLEDLSPRLKNSASIVKAAIAKDKNARHYAGPGIEVGPAPNYEVTEQPLGASPSGLSQFLSAVGSLVRDESVITREQVSQYREGAIKQFVEQPSLLKEERYEELRKDFKTAKALVEKNGLLLEHLPEFQDDADLVLSAIKNHPDAAKFASPRLKDDPNFMRRAAEINKKSLEHMGSALRNDEAFALEMVAKEGVLLDNFDSRIKNSLPVAKAAVKNDPLASGYTGQDIVVTLTPEGEVMLENAKDYWFSTLRKELPKLELVKEKQDCRQSRKEAVETLLTAKEKLLEPEYQKFSRDVITMRELVEKDGSFLEMASPELRDDPVTLLIAVTRTPEAMEFIAPRFKNDPEFMLKAIRANKGNAKYMSDELRGNPNFAWDVVSGHGLALKYFNEEIRGTASIVQVAVEEDRTAFKFADQGRLYIRSESPDAIDVAEKGTFYWLFG